MLGKARTRNGETIGEIGNSHRQRVADLIHRQKDLEACFGRRAVCRRSNDKRSPNTEGQGQPSGVAGNKWPQSQTYTNNTRERFYFPRSFFLFLSLSICTSSFLFYLCGCRPAGRRSSTTIDISIVHGNPTLCRAHVRVETLTCKRTLVRGPKDESADPLPYVGCGRPRTSVHPSFMPFDGLLSIVSTFYLEERTMIAREGKINIVLRIVRIHRFFLRLILAALSSFWRCISLKIKSL